MEDKICRLCGFSNITSRNMFRYPDFVNKVSIVYPILIYNDDPLSKWICPKCFKEVNRIYHSITNVIRVQSSWIEGLRSQNAQSSYLNLIDKIRSAQMAALNSIGVDQEIAIRCFKRTLLLGQRTGVKPDSQPRKEAPKANAEAGKKTQNLGHAKQFECDICTAQFNSQRECFIHKSNYHLKVRVLKMFRKRFVPKNEMLGRKVTTGNGYVRCVHCNKIFQSNKSIMEHWTSGKCEFYCVICGKEFLKAPRELREHESLEHGLSHKTLMAANSKYEHLIDPHTTEASNDSEPAECTLSIPPASQTNSPTLPEHTCNLCNRSFHTKHARNSHMRMHKPSHVFGDKSSKEDKDEYYATRDIGIAEGSRIRKSLPIEITRIGDSMTLENHRLDIDNTAAQETQNTIRGIRTKFVSGRNENKPIISTKASKLEALLTVGKQAVEPSTETMPCAGSSLSTLVPAPHTAIPIFKHSSHAAYNAPMVVLPIAIQSPKVQTTTATSSSLNSASIRVKTMSELREYKGEKLHHSKSLVKKEKIPKLHYRNASYHQ